jgi:hypothetical protein
MPSNVNLCGPLKNYLAGKRFTTDADVKQAVTCSPQKLDTDLFYAVAQILVLRWGKSLKVNGD